MFQRWNLFDADPMEAQRAALRDGSEEEYENNAAAAVPADVYMISGCQDKQTSADVSNVASFGLPPDAGPGGAGGACTNALLQAAYKPGEESWINLLETMRGFLSGRGYSQVPQLSTSRKVDLNQPFEIAGGYGGNRKALLVGINYVNHSSGRLSGCINDVISIKEYICDTEGFAEDEYSMRILIDDPHDPNVQENIRIPTGHPSRDNILSSIDWLVRDAQPGDVLFFHYSGHGGQQRDRNGEEEDGMDETLIPEDYRHAGVITDDELFQELVCRLPMGVRLVCLMDCCHSGTILDLPFMFTATEGNVVSAQSGGGATTFANPGFNSQMGKLLKHGIEMVGSKFGNADTLMNMAQSFGLW
eukprot:Sspe_Gene.31724::Locus_15618_Transcript_1_1_Confidence_1.000_Length_1298::g.31724::m.31724